MVWLPQEPFCRAFTSGSPGREALRRPFVRTPRVSHKRSPLHVRRFGPRLTYGGCVSCADRHAAAGNPTGYGRLAPNRDENQIDGGSLRRIRQGEHVELARKAVDNVVDMFVDRCTALDDI